MQKMLQIKFLRHMKKWKFPRHSELRFRETASTVVDINEKLTTFPVLRKKILITVVITQEYTL
jgi:hypothetical protein